MSEGRAPGPSLMSVNAAATHSAAKTKSPGWPLLGATLLLAMAILQVAAEDLPHWMPWFQCFFAGVMAERGMSRTAGRPF
jgi:hypothetical protein